MKCADIGHLAASQVLHQKWASLLEEELFRQGDAEKESGTMAISALMDRTKGGVTRSQVGFFNIVGVPLLKAYTEVFEDAVPLLDAALENLHYWESKQEG